MVMIYDFVSVERSLLVTNAWLISHGPELTRAAAYDTTSTESFIFGPPRTRADALVVPVVWSVPSSGPFTELQGDLQTARLGPETTHLSLSATCHLEVEPPGRRAQEMAAQRVAEQSVRTFLGSVASALELRSSQHANR